MATDHRHGRSGSYYAVLGVRPTAPLAEIRTAYRKLAMKWHPDRYGREPWFLDEAKRRFQQIQEAYQVLSDDSKRALYDAGLYEEAQEEEEVEGFSEFLQEMLKLMADVRRERKEYSLEELQQMLTEMAQGFDSPPPPPSLPLSSSRWFCPTGSPGNSKRFRHNTDPRERRRSHIHISGMEVFGSSRGYC